MDALELVLMIWAISSSAESEASCCRNVVMIVGRSPLGNGWSWKMTMVVGVPGAGGSGEASAPGTKQSIAIRRMARVANENS